MPAHCYASTGKPHLPQALHARNVAVVVRIRPGPERLRLRGSLWRQGYRALAEQLLHGCARGGLRRQA